MWCSRWNERRREDSVNAQKGLFEPIESRDAASVRTGSRSRSEAADRQLPLQPGLGRCGDRRAGERAETNKASMPVGTGPFKFKRWVKGDRVELERYGNYWGTPVKLTEATFKFIPDPAAAAAACWLAMSMPSPTSRHPKTLAQFEADPLRTVVVGSTEGETILSTNNARPPFDDIRVRQAMAHALDRDAVIDGAMFGYGTPIGSHFAPHHPAYVDLTGRYP